MLSGKVITLDNFIKACVDQKYHNGKEYLTLYALLPCTLMNITGHNMFTPPDVLHTLWHYHVVSYHSWNTVYVVTV